MRIAILSQYFPPEMGAPQARLYELAVRLQRYGHEVTVLTAMPNYPTGRVFAGYRRRLVVRESLEGVQVVRVALFCSDSRRPLLRALSYGSFGASSLAVGALLLGRQDILLMESPPLLLGLSGLPLAKLARARFVMMVSDIWPDVAVRLGGLIGDRQARALERLEAFLYRRAACVAVTNPGAQRQVAARFPETACAVISNGVDRTLFKPSLRCDEVRGRFGLTDGDVGVVYCGLHGVFQGLEVVVAAAELLREEKNVRFFLIGDGPMKAELASRASARGLDNVQFVDRRPKAEIPRLLASMDVGLIPLACRLPGTMPSKVYEALAAGLPIAVTAGCEAEALVRRHGVGIAFEPGDAAGLARDLRRLAKDRHLRRRMCEASTDLAKRFDRDEIATHTNHLLSAIHRGEPLPVVAAE